MIGRLVVTGLVAVTAACSGGEGDRVAQAAIDAEIARVLAGR